jgi:2-methylcitrate dehydratase PrpD
LLVQGFQPTAVFGTFGATAAIASLLECDTRTTKTAFNLAASFVAGLTENIGSLARPVHIGNAAMAGAKAALLADRGITANDMALRDGYFPLYAGVDELGSDVLPDLNNRWAILEEEIIVKKYPTVSSNHTSIAAIQSIMNEHGISPGEIARIHIMIPKTNEDTLLYDDPKTRAEARLSLPYNVACAAIFDEIKIETFDKSMLTNSDVREMMSRVTTKVDPDLPYFTREVTLAVTTTNGDVFSRTEERQPSLLDDPNPDERLKEKFMECATRTIDPDTAERGFSHLNSLKEYEITEIMASLAGNQN